MKTLCGFVISLLLLSRCSAKTETDADIAKALIGTWMPPLSEQTERRQRVTYFTDGHGVEMIWPVGQSESAGVRIETTWAVTNRVLVIKSVKSSDIRRVPVGVELRDRIVSISADQFVFVPESGYGDMEKKEAIRFRVKDVPEKPGTKL